MMPPVDVPATRSVSAKKPVAASGRSDLQCVPLTRFEFLVVEILLLAGRGSDGNLVDGARSVEGDAIVFSDARIATRLFVDLNFESCIDRDDRWIWRGNSGLGWVL